MAEQVAVVDARATAQAAHGVAQLRIDERVDDNRGVTACARDGALEIVHALGARVANLLELLLRKLRLERLDEPRRGLAGRVGDDVQVDGHG